MLQVFHDAKSARAALGLCAVSIGKYDGMHLGHQKILAELKSTASALQASSLVILSEPHPEEFFNPATAPPRLNHFADKTAFLSRFGIDGVFCLRFDVATSNRSAEDFVRHTLVDELGIRAIVVGEDFRFGHKRGGSIATLESMAAQHNFSVRAVGDCVINNERISSTLVRHYLNIGDCRRVADCLGRPYSISGRVIRGRQLGRQLGFPTANVELHGSKPPLCGVFVVHAELHGKLLPAVASLGYNPTVNEGQQVSLEVFLLDFSAEIYHEQLVVSFLHKLRDEIKFDELSQLQDQMAADVRAARLYLGV